MQTAQTGPHASTICNIREHLSLMAAALRAHTHTEACARDALLPASAGDSEFWRIMRR